MSQQYQAGLQALGSIACTQGNDETPTYDEGEWVVVEVGHNPTNVPGTNACESKDSNQDSADTESDVLQEQEGPNTHKVPTLLAAISEYRDKSHDKLDASTKSVLDDLVEAWTTTQQDDGCVANREFHGMATASGWKPEHGLECLSVVQRRRAVGYRTVKVLSVRVASRHSDISSRIGWKVFVNERYLKVECVERLQELSNDRSAHNSGEVPETSPSCLAGDNINQWLRGIDPSADSTREPTAFTWVLIPRVSEEDSSY